MKLETKEGWRRDRNISQEMKNGICVCGEEEDEKIMVLHATDHAQCGVVSANKIYSIR